MTNYVIVVTTGKPDFKFDCLLNSKIYKRYSEAEHAVVSSKAEDIELGMMYEYRIIPVDE